MKRRTIALLLAMALCLSLLPMDVFAANIPAPSNLEWNESTSQNFWVGEGNICWDIDDGVDSYEIELYCGNEMVFSVIYEAVSFADDFSFFVFSAGHYMFQTGSYKVRVRAWSEDWEQKSAFVESSAYNFTHPGVSFATPTNLQLNGTILSWQADNSSLAGQLYGEQLVTIYEQNSDMTWEQVIWGHGGFIPTNSFDLAGFLNYYDELFEEMGIEPVNLKVTVRTASNDILNVGNGAESEPLYFVYDGNPTPQTTSISLDKTSLIIPKGTTEKLNAIVAPINASVTWSSSDNSIVSVDNTGEVTAVGYGKATITASSGGLKAICMITVFDDEISDELFFAEWPLELNNSLINYHINEIMNTCANTLADYNNNFLSAWKYALKEGGISVIVDAMLGNKSLDKDMKKNITDELLLCITNSDTYIAESVDEAQDFLDMMEYTVNSFDDATRAIVERDLANSFKNVSYDEIHAAADKYFEHSSQLGDIMDSLQYSLDFVEVMTTVVYLQNIRIELVDDLILSLPAGSSLRSTLIDIKRELEGNLWEAVLSRFLDKEFTKLFVETIKAMGDGTTLKSILQSNFSALSIFLAEAIVKVGAELIPNASADELIKTIRLSACATELNTALLQWRIDYLTTKPSKEDIERYKLLFNARLEALKLTLENAKKIAKTDARKTEIEWDLNLLQMITWENYMKICKRAVLQKESITYNLADNKATITDNTDSAFRTSALYLDIPTVIEESSIIYIPENVDGHSVSAIADYSFQNNNDVRVVIFEASISKIGDYAFSNCPNLETVIFLDRIYEIGAYAFSNCPNLSSIKISDGTEVIGENAFADCTSLREVSIPASVNSIGNNAFSNCSTNLLISGNKGSIANILATNLSCEFEEAEVIANSVEIYTMPYKTSYQKGDEFDTTGLAIKIMYSDGSSDIVSSGYSLYYNFDETGLQNVAIFFNSAYAILTVNVGDNSSVRPPAGNTSSESIIWSPAENITPETNLPFTDVTESNWFYESVKYSYERGLFNGTSATTFSPNEQMSRAMLVTVLWRLSGKPVTSGVTFNDVPSGKWYSAAVAWASEYGIANGYGNETFGIHDDITRQDLSVILLRYAKLHEYALAKLRDYQGFNDDSGIAEYAKEAVKILFNAQIIDGKSNNLFDPIGNATRAETAKMLMNFLKAI